MELKDRCEQARKLFDELHLTHSKEGTTTRVYEDFEWLKLEVSLIQAEALTRLAYKSFL